MKRMLFLMSLSVLLLLFSNNVVMSQAPSFIIGSAANVSSTTIVIPVTASNFVQLIAWQGSVNWDNSKLNYIGVSTPVSQLAGIQFNPSVSSSTGRLSFIWVDNNLSPETITNNTVLFNITFSVVSGAAGSCSIFFSNTPTPLLLSDASGNAVSNVGYINGSVTFPGQPIPPEFIIGSAQNISGTTISIPVTTKNFNQLLGWQGSVNWDNTKLTYSGVSGLAPQLSGMQFNTSVITGTGRLSFAWTENNLIAQTLSDSTVLFTMSFNIVNGASGASDIFFSNTPTQLLVSDANSNALVGVVYTKGTIYFAGAFIPPHFIIGSVYNVSTSTFSIPVTSKNFTQLLAWQGSVSWDNSKISYSGVIATLPQLSGMQFNSSVTGTTGKLSFLWADNNNVAQTIPDNTVLFTLNFTVTGAYSGITYIDFSGIPTSLVVSDASGSAIANVVYSKGTVTFSSNFCVGGNSSITSNVTGVSYQWQVNSGNGYSNITDNTNYSGSSTSMLTFNNIPTSWVGNMYRCQVNGLYSAVFTVRFINYWLGNSGVAWENPANWSCGNLPDANTNVVINSGTVVINSNVTINSLTLNQGVTATVTSGYTLLIRH